MSKIALLFVTDGRKHFAERTLESLRQYVRPSIFSYAIAVDDSLDPKYSAWLDGQWGWTTHLPPGKEKRGFGGAIQAGWDAIPADVDYIFHLEDDFVFNQRPTLAAMRWILQSNPHVQQVALKRQPWNPQEAAAGDMALRWGADSFVQREGDDRDGAGGWPKWYEHRIFFTTNPSMYRRSLIERGWPTGPQSEGRFSVELFASDPLYQSAFLGTLGDKPWVEHIGGEGFVSERTGTNY